MYHTLLQRFIFGFLIFFGMLLNVQAGNTDDNYIIVFKDGATSTRNIEQKVHSLITNQEDKIKHIYKYAMKGFAATLSAEELEKIQTNDSIQAVYRTSSHDVHTQLLHLLLELI